MFIIDATGADMAELVRLAVLGPELVDTTIR